MSKAQDVNAVQAVFVDAKGRRWTPKLTGKVVWEYEQACGVSLFETVFGLSQPEADADGAAGAADGDAGKMFAGVQGDALRVALKLFGRPRNVAFLIHSGCCGRPHIPSRDLILVDDDSGAFVRGIAGLARFIRRLFSPRRWNGRVSLDNLGDAITTSRLMGEAILCAHQAVIDFFPEMLPDAEVEADAANPTKPGNGKT